MSQNEPSDDKNDTPVKEELPESIKTVINQQSSAIESLMKENISLRTEIKDLRAAMPEMAKAGASEVLQMLGVPMNKQPEQPSTQTVQVQQNTPNQNITLNPATLLDPNTLQGLANLATAAKDIYDKFTGNQDATTSLSFTNYKSFVKLQETIMQNLLSKAWRSVAQEFNLKSLPQEARPIIDHAV